jgi:hypothetical protein
MAVGNAVAHANSELNVWRGTAHSGWTSATVRLHTGDPGAAGTANASGETAAQTVTFNAASGGSMALASSVSWTAWDVGTETITHISIWDNNTTFKRSAALTASRTVNDGDTFTLSTLTVSKTPLAA